MIVSLSASVLWLLAMLAATVHLQDAGRSPGNGLRAAATFGLILPLASWLSPQPNWVAVLLALAAFWRLIAGPLPRIGGALAGASAGLAAALQIAGGVPWWLAAPVTGLGLACAFAWGGSLASSSRPRESVLVAVALAMPPVGLAGDLVFGWQSATMLGRDGVDVAAPAPPTWAIGVIGLALLAGLAKGFWVRR